MIEPDFEISPMTHGLKQQRIKLKPAESVLGIRGLSGDPSVLRLHHPLLFCFPLVGPLMTVEIQTSFFFCCICYLQNLINRNKSHRK